MKTGRCSGEGENWRSARGRRESPQKKREPRQTKARSWPKSTATPSFYSQLEERRRQKASAEEDMYTGSPPMDRMLVDCRLVIPGKHMLPQGLDHPTAFRDVCRSNKVWITRLESEPNIIHIRSETMLELQNGLAAVNRAIRDMRLENEHQSPRFLIQSITRAARDMARITLVLNARPFIANAAQPPNNQNIFPEPILSDLCADIGSSFETLRVVGSRLKMSVRFGQFIVRAKKRGLTDQISYDDFLSLMNMYPRRGGAIFEPRNSNPQLARLAVERLASAEIGLCQNPREVEYSCTLELVAKDGIVNIGAASDPAGRLRLLDANWETKEHSPRLNWTVSAPDMKFDWNLKVQACTIATDIPVHLRGLLRCVNIKLESDLDNALRRFEFPIIRLQPATVAKETVDVTRLKISAVLPFQDTMYVVRVTVTRTWMGFNSDVQPEDTWEVDFYGLHWDETMNCVSTEDRRKDWGQDFANIWPGEEPDVSVRIRRFLQTIFRIQHVLNELE
ncbi:hypothetical protein S40285_05967 [Stachybotrys chlorohalonatus IBT 40285]|uniref:Uncharacterized protein n=1 Tax=Stachybotrys chlorohalonatus (strain IBT 40285) TaxID=1283841 RepID=A0A084QBH3_STAC4|nr:hypothetical protein S40285_05967 [Stachybotrys chlorohalonata IBT 40285]